MKKIKFKLSMAILILSWSISTYASMLPDENGNIIINNVKKTMLGHIQQVLLMEPNSSFKNTHIVTYNENKFSIVGTITNFPEKYIKLISDNDYTYLPFYKIERIGWKDVEFGAILVGHKNINLAQSLHFATQENLFKITSDNN